MAYSLIKQALKEACPCTGCKYAEKCKKYELACRRFLWFIIEREWESIPKRMPTGLIYKKIYEDEGEYQFKKFVNSLIAKGV